MGLIIGIVGVIITIVVAWYFWIKKPPHTKEEEQKIVNISLAQNFPQMREQIRRSLLGSITGIIIFISKSAILDHKYSLDTMDNTDNNTLRLARGVSAKVFGMLPKILNEVYTETIKSLRNDVTGE